MGIFLVSNILIFFGDAFLNVTQIFFRQVTKLKIQILEIVLLERICRFLKHLDHSILKFESKLRVHGHTEILDLDWVDHVNAKNILHQLESTQILQLRVPYMEYS
jgi:hypothetical protein